MTQDVAAARVDLERLCERLEKAVTSQGRSGAAKYNINPDGPQAARAIRSLLARVAALEEGQKRAKLQIERILETASREDAQSNKNGLAISALMGIERACRSFLANPQDERGRE